MSSTHLTLIQAPVGYKLQCADGSFSLVPLSSKGTRIIEETLKNQEETQMLEIANKPLDLTVKTELDDSTLTIMPTSPPQSPIKASNHPLRLFTPRKFESRLSELPPELVTAVDQFRPIFPHLASDESVFSAESNFTCDGMLFCCNREARRERQKKV